MQRDTSPRGAVLAPEKLSKAVKVGRSSLMLSETTHKHLGRLAALHRSSYLSAMRYVLDAASESLADFQEWVLRRIAEEYERAVNEPEMRRERRARLCRARGWDELTASQAAEDFGLEMLEQCGWRRPEEDDASTVGQFNGASATRGVARRAG